MTRKLDIAGAEIGGDGPLLIIAGPCVIEDRETMLTTAREMRDICASLGLPFVFKSSYDKANRSSVTSPRGPGIEAGLAMLKEIKETLGVPVLSDVHTPDEATRAATVLDALQIPAFLCRQTDLIVAASKTGLPVNIKKGQFLAPWDVKNIIEKARSTGNENIMLTERGTTFGYGNLVVDFKGVALMRTFGYPVVFDLTHSLQLPGAQGTFTGGERQYAAPLMRAACGAGIDGLFIEVHPEPDRALSDKTTVLALKDVRKMLEVARDIHAIAVRAGSSER